MQVRVLVAVLIAASALASPAAADRIVAVAPLSTLGAEDTSAATKKLTGEIEAGIAALPGTKLVTAAQVADAIKRAKKPQLKSCEGDAGCLAEVGKLVGAQLVVTGEVGGLGEAKVVYLGATDVTTAKELRSTTLSIGANDDGGGPNGAAIRLLDPDRYRGVLRFAIDATGATVYVNGSRSTLSAKGELTLPVGRQAVRVTHPEYRDFVRFIDVSYGRTTDVPVNMTQYPIIQHDVTGKPTNRDRVEVIEPPIYRRWYVVGPAAIVLAVATGIIVSYAVHDFPSGVCRKVGGADCAN